MRRNKEQSEWGLPHEDMRLCFKRKEPANLEEVHGGWTPLSAKEIKKHPFSGAISLERIMSLVKKTLDKRF